MIQDEVMKIKAELPADVCLMAVSKTRSRAEVEAAWQAGIHVFGENRVQELKEKAHENDPFEWHMIGHLQTNKAVSYTHLPHAAYAQSHSVKTLW